jgi:hypothetical protein
LLGVRADGIQYLAAKLQRRLQVKVEETKPLPCVETGSTPPLTSPTRHKTVRPGILLRTCLILLSSYSPLPSPKLRLMLTPVDALVARIDRKLLSGSDIFFGQQTYAVTIAPGVDMALVAALCICLDEKNNES